MGPRAFFWGLLIIVTGSVAAEDLSFPMKVDRLDDKLKGMPLLEGSLSFVMDKPAEIRQVPMGLSNIEYVTLLLAPNSRLIGLRGTDAAGARRLFMDRDSDGDFSDEKSVALEPGGNNKGVVVPKGKTTLLTFWSPRCSGSKAEAVLYDRMADEFKGNSSVNLIAVISDESDLKDYLKQNRHSFRHVVSTELWTRYGVSAPFVTLIIDGQGKIRKRYFRFNPEIAEMIRKCLASARSVASDDDVGSVGGRFCGRNRGDVESGGALR
jgi:hypothetical protein